MIDIVDAKRRSEMMAGIEGRDTAPERKACSIAHAMGLRFRLYRKELNALKLPVPPFNEQRSFAIVAERAQQLALRAQRRLGIAASLSSTMMYPAR